MSGKKAHSTPLPVVAALAAAAALTTIGMQQTAVAGEKSDIAAFICSEHQDSIGQITTLAQRPAPIGPEASKLLDLVKPHMLRNENILLPPLTLMPLMAEVDAAQSMRWALPLIDRIRYQQPQNFREQQKIALQLNALTTAAQEANDPEAVDVAKRIAATILEDDEVIQPTLLLIGQHLRAKPHVGM